MKKNLTFVIILLFVIGLFGCGTSESSKKNTESVTLIANSVWPEDNFMSQGLIDFSQKIYDSTDGNLEIDVKAGGALGYEGAELLTAVRDNIISITDLLAFGVEGDEPLFGLSSLPFLVQNYEENKLLNEIARPYYEKVAEEKWNQKILYVVTWPGAGFWTQNKVETVEDFKNLKVRTADGNGAYVVQKIGGKPYQLPFAEVYSSLATGVIDSVLTSSPSAVDGKFWEVLDYYIPANVTMGVSFVTINLDEFNKLDKEIQETLINIGKEIETTMWDRVIEIDKENEKLVNDQGIITIQPNDDLMNSLSEITEELRQNWLDQAPSEAKEIVEKFNEEVNR